MRLRRLALSAGLALLVTGGALVAGVAGHGGVAVRGGLLLLLVGALLAAAGALGRRFAAAWQGAALVLLNTLLLLVVLELAAGLVRPPRDEIRQDLFGRADQRTPTLHWTIPYYRARAWSGDYWRELHAIGTWYHPYVIWRRFPFRGRYIAVDSAGVRRTPGADCGPGAFRVFAIGGSVMWGFGAPDSATIPYYLQRALAERLAPRPVCVVNLSEHGFNTTQDVIELQQRLVRGDVPDLVLQLQGANDVWAAYSSGQAGVHGFLGEIAGKLEQGQGTSPAARLLGRLALVRLLRPPAPPREVTRWTMPDTTLADRVVDIYLENYRLLRLLGEAYGFEVHAFWQPVIYEGRKPLLPEEEAMRRYSLQQEVPAWPHMFARSFADVARRAPRDGHFHDLRDAFDDRRDDMYIDWAHLTPEGNKVLAARMLAAVDLARWEGRSLGRREGAPPAAPTSSRPKGSRRLVAAARSR
ncbi:MAG TPA: SGNH/GDSL hydrolase family protein [Gemmatimonadales bacterium]|nr:SGNH/GDSL hydrolase family protein [Gemmatimonadales bacterium]